MKTYRHRDFCVVFYFGLSLLAFGCGERSSTVDDVAVEPGTSDAPSALDGTATSPADETAGDESRPVGANPASGGQPTDKTPIVKAPPSPVVLPKTPRQREVDQLRRDFLQALPTLLSNTGNDGPQDGRQFCAMLSTWLDQQDDVTAETKEQVLRAFQMGLGIKP